MVLYHYTCAHGYKAIGRYGTLVPQPQIVMDRRLIWLTDCGDPNRPELGLTQHVAKCDRLAYRYVVKDLSSVVPWDEYRLSVPLDVRCLLEASAGADPSRWFVSETALPATLDRGWGCASPSERVVRALEASADELARVADGR